jgi:hypothetical protein
MPGVLLARLDSHRLFNGNDEDATTAGQAGVRGFLDGLNYLRCLLIGHHDSSLVFTTWSNVPCSADNPLAVETVMAGSSLIWRKA